MITKVNLLFCYGRRNKKLDRYFLSTQKARSQLGRSYIARSHHRSHEMSAPSNQDQQVMEFTSVPHTTIPESSNPEGPKTTKAQYP